MRQRVPYGPLLSHTATCARGPRPFAFRFFLAPTARWAVGLSTTRCTAATPFLKHVGHAHGNVICMCHLPKTRSEAIQAHPEAAVRKPLRIRHRAAARDPACLVDVPDPLPWHPTIYDVRCARWDLLTSVARRSRSPHTRGGVLPWTHSRNIYFSSFDHAVFCVIYLVHDPTR